MKEPDVLTRMRLCECWGDSLNVEELKEVNDYIEELQQENQELKKQLEKKYEKVGTLTGELLYEENTKLINQQKEFIEWLEECVETYERTSGCEFEIPRLILSKYKEIIGGRNE